jgi:proline iminopeptidase
MNSQECDAGSDRRRLPHGRSRLAGRDAVQWFFPMLLVAGCVSPAVEPSSTPIHGGYFTGADNHRLYYRSIGRGPDTVVVVHGFQGNDANYLAPDLLPLAGDRTLLVYDQRGGGRSDAVSGPEHARLDDHVRDLEALRQHFGLERLRLFGHSGGAAIVLQYAGSHIEKTERAVLVAPPPLVGEGYGAETGRAFTARLDSATWARVVELEARLPSAEDPAAICREISQIMLPRAFLADPTAFGRMQGDLCSAPAERLRTRAQRTEAFVQSLQGRAWDSIVARITIPVLVLHGDQDAIPPASARELAQMLPNGRVVVLPRADHLPWLDQPDAFFAAADSFFRGKWAASGSSRH